MNLRSILEQRITAALRAAGAGDAPAMVAPSARPQFGDYQANGCMTAAKRLKLNPRTFAEKVLENLDLSDLAEKVELAGPGFINIFLNDGWIAERLGDDDERLGVAKPQAARTVVVDYSSPNLAKEMHVGHLRSTIIGDALARVLKFLRHTVHRQNHVGDWGTQFGMLVEYIVVENLVSWRPGAGTATTGFSLGDLEEVYRKAKQKFDNEPDFAAASRDRVVKLQAHDEQTLDLWKWFKEESLNHCQQVYDRLGVLLTEGDVCGESFYNDDLRGVVADLDEAGLLVESQGAMGVFLDEFRSKDDERAFVIVRKSDGGYLYATTDLAAMRYRADKLQADRILYVTDSRQAQHFAQVFLIAKKAGFVGEGVCLEHVPFGMMLGTDGRPFKTRVGGTVKLTDLLDEAQGRAAELVREKNPDLDESRVEKIARTVGIGAVKYADLSQNRTSDYVFSWDKMLALEGNTAPYMQYAYARIRSIFRKGEEISDLGFSGYGGLRPDERISDSIQISQPAERVLGVKLLQFPEAVDAVAENCMPSVLCGYLFELAGAFMGFYESCPVLKAEPTTRDSRLALCDLTARVIKKGLELLGIETLEQM